MWTKISSTRAYRPDRALDDTGSGARAAGAPLPVFTLDQIAYQLTDLYWTNQGDIRAGFDVSAGGTITVDITGLTAPGQQLARWALDAWSAASGLNFAEVGSGAQITFDDEAGGAYSSSSLSGGHLSSSFVNVSKSDWLPYYGTTIDSYSFQTYIHEIGHALGLGHAGNYNGSASYSQTGSGDNHYLNDSWQASVMSYFDQVENTYVSADRAYVVTPMQADVIAIQDLYGAGVSTNPGNTTYGANSTLGGYLGALFGQIFGEDPADPQIYSGAEVTLTIFDSGGTDTLDFSPATANQRIDLGDAAISDVLGLTGNLSIARGTVIENAIGGAGADTILGNGAANDLKGEAGNDTLVGGPGADTLDGGAGTDLADYSGSAGAVGVRLDGVVGWAGAAGDVINGVENLVASAFNDTVVGSDGANLILAGAGADRVYALDGDDTLQGGAGDDTLYGQGGDDLVEGGSGNDLLFGQSGDDRLYGQGGDDTLAGGSGADTLDGGAGTDLADYSLSGAVGVRLDGIVGWAGAAGDVINGVENLVASAFNDTVVGSDGANLILAGAGADRVYALDGDDTLQGGAGDDTLYGQGGDDLVEGGSGNDLLFGQSGDDSFVFADGFGQDVIGDFNEFSAAEKIDLSALTTIASYAALTGNNHMSQQGADVVIDDFAGNTITLLNVLLGNLDSGDFVF